MRIVANEEKLPHCSTFGTSKGLIAKATPHVMIFFQIFQKNTCFKW